jgi:hypothetical protein
MQIKCPRGLKTETALSQPARLVWDLSNISARSPKIAKTMSRGKQNKRKQTWESVERGSRCSKYKGRKKTEDRGPRAGEKRRKKGS